MPPDTPDLTLDFARLRTPTGHGDVLVEPSAAGWADLAVVNCQRLAKLNFHLLDLSGAELRRMVRQSAGVSPDDLAIVSGHEPELTHPGVLAKHVMADRLARNVGGTAVNLIVDHDSPKHTMIDVPTFVEGRLALGAVPYLAPPRGRAFELIPPMGAEGWRRFEHQLRGLLADRFDRSSLPAFVHSARQARSPGDWVDQWAAGRRAIEAEIGVHMEDHRTSRLWPGPLLAHMILDAPRLAASYNAALAEHRRRYRIRGPGRPIPDLVIDEDRVEVPAWVYRRHEARRRLFVRTRGEATELFAERDSLGTLAREKLRRWETAGAVLAELEGVMFRPRALTLTLWARLFLADLFIHGIGGARYDGITDAIIRKYFGVEPPAMTCVSATLLLDLPRDPTAERDLATAQRRMRDVRFNPQRYVADDAVRAPLLRERDAAVRLSTSLRAERPGDHESRRHAFMAIRDLNERILSSSPAVIERLTGELELTKRRFQENDVANRRDYFFGLHSRESLQVLVERLS